MLLGGRLTPCYPMGRLKLFWVGWNCGRDFDRNELVYPHTGLASCSAFTSITIPSAI